MSDALNGGDAALISQASGGRALRGLAIIEAENELTAAVGKQMVLSPPTGMAVMGSNQASFSVAYCFSRSEESASFSKTVMDKGWSIATRIHAQQFLWGASVEASFDMNKNEHKVTEEQLSRKVSEACITQCIFMPIKSFQIPRSKMFLSEAAVERALTIRDEIDADNFLTAFNPFVSESLYHMGGVFFREVTVKCSEETSLFALMHQTQEEMKGSVKGKVQNVIFSVEGEVSGSKSERSDNSSQKTSAVKLEERIEKTITLGPSTALNDTEFVQKLKDDPHCWAIIDKDADGKDSLVGVWELLLQHSRALIHSGDASAASKLKSSAKILCERWLYRAERRRLNFIQLPSEAAFYSALINECNLFVANLASDPMFKRNQALLQGPPLPLLLDLPQEASVIHLLHKLDQVLVQDAGEPFRMSQHAANHVRYFIRNHQKPPQTSALRALEVLCRYGFDHDGNLLIFQLDCGELTSMIQELKENQNAPRSRESIPSSAWGPDLTIQGMPASSLQSASYQFHYVGDVVVDRNFYAYPHAWEAGSQAPARARRLIDCFRHRVNPLKHLLQGTSDHTSRVAMDSWDSASEEDEDLQASTIQQEAASPFELLIQIIQGSDIPSKIAVCDLLLSQRSAAPLILIPSFTPLKAPQQEAAADVQLVHYIQALSFVQVSLEKQQKVCIAEDTSLPRVVFISNKSVQASHAAIIASRVLNCDFMSQHCRKDMSQLAKSTVVEVGVGFIPASPSTQGESEYLACVSIQITGPYQPVMRFVDDIADVVVLELEQGHQHRQYPQSIPFASNPSILRWQETDMEEGRHKKSRLIWGQESYLVKGIGDFLYSEVQKLKELKVRKSMLEVCTRHFTPGHELISFEGPQMMIDQCDFSDIRNSLTLQRSLVVEAKAYFECLQLKHDPAKKREKERVCVQERDRRLRLAKDVMHLPIMKLFYSVLKQDDFASRKVGIMWLEGALSQKMYPILKDASARVDELFHEFSKKRNNDIARRHYIEAKQEYVEKSAGLDNLWRELSHIYEADPKNQRHLVKKAAQHLLDGFPLEILDGDAGMFCKTWVESVLVELDSMTKAKAKGRAARIFVLSVMGLQSSGKSTMLNLMFGTQLRTSAGRCTRGVYIQLVPSERAEYDYVLLLDTEGLRSPEYFGLEASEVRDNRLATFGLLPADASVFMVSNEDDSGLKEVLPMVLLAFKGSAIAKRCGQRIKAKVVFVYRSVDTNDTNKLKGNRQKLHEHLREAAEEVTRMGGGVLSSATEAEEMLEIVFADFRVDDDEKQSDVKCLGNLKKGGIPPTDTPEWAYGERVVEIREYLHKRVMDDTSGFKALSFPEWGERLTLVWDCICSADFELSFKSKIEYNAYLELQARLQPPRKAVHETYMEVFSSVERQMRENTIGEQENSTSLGQVFDGEVADVVAKQTDEVDRILAMNKSYAKWRPQELENWRRFCAITKDWYQRRITDLESGVLRFEEVVAAYQQQCKSIILAKFDSGEWGLAQSGEQSRDHVWREKFEQVFKRILEDAERAHPPIANDVHKKVMDRYTEAGLAKMIDMYANVNASARSESNKSGSVFGWAKRNIFGQGDKVQNDPIYSELQLIIDRQLRDARQYSDIIVDNVISVTRGRLDTTIPHLSREEKGVAHIWVKNTLTNRMKEIQSLWDKDHNVVEKLKSLRDNLYDFFAGLANGLEAAAMLVGELQRCLEDELEEAHSAAVVRYVGDMLGTQNLVREWRIMRALLDYHLLSLQTSGNTGKLLRYVTDGGTHFAMMMDAVVGQAIERELVQRQWNELLQKVQRCLEGQASLRNPSVREFVAALGRRLADAVDGKLASTVRSSIHMPMYENSELDSDFYEKKLPELYESLQRKEMPDLEKRRGAMIKAVIKDMEELPDENCRPRCGAPCPMCGSTCFHAKGHVVQARHDCVHQPAGLCGTGWYGTHELVERTCLQMLETECTIVLDKEGTSKIPFSDFEKHYSSWTLPSSNESLAIQVRECIFFNFQEELVKFFSPSEVKRCPPEKMPTAYKHNPESLRAALYNNLRPKFTDDHAWNRFSQLLQSL